MNAPGLKRFAARAREQLVPRYGERSAYTWFMRLCAAYISEPTKLKQIMQKDPAERHADFSILCSRLAEELGGIFTIYGDIQPFPDPLLADGGTADELIRLTEAILPHEPESLCWLHQNFSEPVRAAAINALKRRAKLNSDDIAAFTQIFTPDWLVRYMVQNSLVRYWYEHGGTGLPSDCTSHFCGNIAQNSGCVSPEDITFLDPCAGCGNILLYAFDVFLEMYRSRNIPDDIAVRSIFRRNLFGLELDERACAVSETALRLKARRFGVSIVPQIYSFAGIEGMDAVGSLASPEMLRGKGGAAQEIQRILSARFDVVSTNPPYLASAGMNAELSAFVKSHYAPYKPDLFAVFMVRCLELTRSGGALGFLTPYVWLFIRSFEQLRRHIYRSAAVHSLIQLEYSAFEDATVPVCAFTLSKSDTPKNGIYFRLNAFRGGLSVQEEMFLCALRDPACGYVYTASAADFQRIPCAPMAYWIPPRVTELFSGMTVADFSPVRQGMITGDNDRFLRLWFEVESENIAFSRDICKKWHPINKGGSYRRWYGNRLHVVNWACDGAEIRTLTDEHGRQRSRPQNLEFNFRPSVSWTLVTSSDISVRLYDENFMFNVAGSSAFPGTREDIMYLLALLNSTSAAYLMSVVNPTMNLNVGDISRLPLPECTEKQRSRLIELAQENAELCKSDWDSSETSWDFRRHPLIK